MIQFYRPVDFTSRDIGQYVYCLGNMCIAIAFCPLCDVINFGSNLK